MNSSNIEQTKTKVIFDITQSYQKSIYDCSTIKEMEMPTHLLFKQISDEVFDYAENIAQAYAPQDGQKGKTPKQNKEH